MASRFLLLALAGPLFSIICISTPASADPVTVTSGQLVVAWDDPSYFTMSGEGFMVAGLFVPVQFCRSSSALQAAPRVPPLISVRCSDPVRFIGCCDRSDCRRSDLYCDSAKPQSDGSARRRCTDDRAAGGERP